MEPKAPQEPPVHPLRATYDLMVKDEYEVPATYEQFELQALQDKSVIPRLHKLYKSNHWDAPEDETEFSNLLLGDLKKNSGGTASATGGATTGMELPEEAPLPPNDQEFRQLPEVGALGYGLPGDPTQPQVYAPDFTGPVPAGTYERPSDKGTAQEGTQYFGEQQPAPAEAPDVADDGFFASFGKSLYNGLDAKRVGGNLLDYFGDLAEIAARAGIIGQQFGNGAASRPEGLASTKELASPLATDKPSDQLAADLLSRAQASDLPLSHEAQQGGFSSLAGAGNILGSGVASIVPVAVASAVGGPAAGAGVGGALGVSATKDAARAAGIGDKEATIMATVLAPIQAALEAVGVQDPGVSKLAIRATIREALAAGGGKLTARALASATKQVVPEIGRRVAGGAGREALTEFLQGEAEGGAKLIADATRDPSAPGNYNATVSNDLVKGPLMQAGVGAILGGTIAPFHGGTHVEAPTEFTTPTIDERRFDLRRPTGQTELSNVQVVALDERTGIATVRGQDAQGKAFQRDVPGGQLYPSKVQPEAQQPTEQTYFVTGDSSTTEEGALPEARIIGPGTQPNTVLIEAKTYEGETVQREVPKTRLLPNEPGEGFDPALVTTEPTAPDTPPADAPPATPARPAEPEPSAPEAPMPATSPPAEPDAPVRQVRAAEPDPASIKALTPQQQASNAALDALDRYNALDARAKKGKEGSAIRAEIAEQARLGGLQAAVKGDFSMSVTRDGKRATRSNEYTATTPAANHVPLGERPEPVRQFAEKVLAATDASIVPLQGLGIKLRGKELSARELQGAVEDIRAGKNTLRAQLVLDTLETAHEQGYVEKSEGTGLSTRKYQVPIGEYVGDAQPTSERPISDGEIDELAAQNPNVVAAIDSYTNPETGEVDYASLAEHGGRGALETFFDVSPEVAAKVVALANERANQPVQQPEAAAEPLAGGLAATNGSPTQGSPQPDGPDSGSPGPAPVAERAEPLAGPSEEKKAQIRAEIDAASQRIKERRAERKKAGRVFSSPLGIGEIDAADLADALTIAKGHVQLGVLGIKNLIAKIREAGLDEEAASDAALKPILQELLTGEKPPELPVNEPNGSATRSSMARLDNDPATPEALKQRVRDTGLDKYEPKSVAETEKAVDAYMQRNSLSDAYAEAISTTDSLTGDVRTALRVRVLKALGDQLTTALDSGDTASADAYLEQAEKVTEALAKRGTDAGREINAYKLLVTQTPEAAVYKSSKEIKAQYEKEIKRLERKVARQRKQIEKLKQEALDNALASDGVRGVRDQVTGSTRRRTTRENIQAVRARRADLFAELGALSKQKPAVAYVSVVPITPQMAKAAEIYVAIFRTYIREGVLETKALVERIRKDGGPALAQVPRKQLEASATEALRLAKVDDAVHEGVQDLGTTIEKIARDFLQDPESVGKTLAQRFVEKAGLSEADAKAYADAIEKEFARRISRAREQRLKELDGRAVAKTGKRATQSDLDKTRELFTLSPTDDAAILDHLKRVNDLPELTTQDVAELRKLAQAVQKAPEGFQKDEAVEKLLKRQADIKGVNWAEIGQAMWYSNVLSGYKTHVINFTANVIQTGAELGVNTTHALLTGKGRYAAASGKGLIQGLSRGVREAVSVLTTGRETSREPGKYEVPSILENIRFAGGAANPANYLKFVNRALRAGDVLFSGGLKEMRAYEQAVKFALEDAKSDGTPNQDIWARAAEKLYNTKQRVADARAQAQAEGLTGNDLARRVYEIAEQSRGADIMEDARVYAPRAVFNGEVEGVLGVVSNGIQQITEAVNVRGVRPLKFIVPFTRVITNVANAYLDYTPVGTLRAIKGSHFVKEGSTTQREFSTEERQKLLIKSVVGAAFMAAAYAASSSDKDDERLLEITGAGTGNPAKDAQLRADGWQPYSFKINGTWYSYANAPIGAMLAVVGNVNDGQKYRGELLSDDDGALNTLYLGAWRAMQFTKDMTALKSATDFLTALSSRNAVDLTNYGQRLAVGTVKGFVPLSSFLTQTAKDYEMLKEQPRKQGRSFGQMLAQDIPMARNSINNALDALGDPLPVDTDRLFSAPPHRDEPTQRIWNWLNKNGLFVPVPNRNSGGALLLKVHQGKEVPMTDDEYYRFMRTRGKLLKGYIQLNISELEKVDAKTAKTILAKYSQAANAVAKAQEFGPASVPDGEQLGEPDEE